MDYLLSFVSKGAHFVNLVEKLCDRMRLTDEPQQWRYFAHCLSLLQYSDKAVVKLQDSIRSFERTLHDSKVYASFCDVLQKARKAVKAAELREGLDELEAKFNELHSKGLEDAAASKKAEKASKALARKQAKAKGGKPKPAPNDDDAENVAPAAKAAVADATEPPADPLML